MSTFFPDRRERIDSFLRRNGYQQYRILILLQCGAIQRVRDKSGVTLSKNDDRVEAGDVLTISDPLPKKCQRAFKKIPDTDFRDYAFVPGDTAFDKAMREVMPLRPQTTLLTSPGNLSDFINALSSSKEITHPIRHLLVASHANDEGHLFLALDFATAKDISYEDLEIARDRKSIRIDPELLNPRPDNGTPIPAAFHIKGCRIGHDGNKPFLEILKNALDGARLVTAPKHFHLVRIQETSPAGRGEWMAYSFSLDLPKKLKDRTEAIRKFDALGFPLADGKPATRKMWGRWIPKGNPNKTRKFGIRIINPTKKKKDKFPSEFRFARRSFISRTAGWALKKGVHKATGGIPMDKDPGTDKERKKLVRDALVKTDKTFRDTHPFPRYVRLGYKSMDEFMDGWTWTFTPKKAEKELWFQAVRYEYTVTPPIVNSKNEVFMNFYPSKSKDKAKLLVQLKEDDPRFFQTV